MFWISKLHGGVLPFPGLEKRRRASVSIGHGVGSGTLDRLLSDAYGRGRYAHRHAGYDLFSVTYVISRSPLLLHVDTPAALARRHLLA